jgi:ribonuclease-3
MLGSGLEALVGAVFLEFGSDKTRDFALQHIVLPSVALAEEAAEKDYKSQLQEVVQKRCRETPEYRTVSASGPDHNKQFDVEVLIQGQVYGHGSGSRKKSAENAAAQAAIEQFEKEPPCE